MRNHLRALAEVLFGSLLATGCATLLASPATHGHPPGPHGGTVAEWSDGRHHVELTVDHAKQEATVYVLDGSARGNAPLRAKTLRLTIKDPPFELELAAAPLAGEPKDTSSRFVGRHEQLGKKQEFAGTISGEVSKLYTAEFAEEPEGHSH